MDSSMFATLFSSPEDASFDEINSEIQTINDDGPDDVTVLDSDRRTRLRWKRRRTEVGGVNEDGRKSSYNPAKRHAGTVTTSRLADLSLKIGPSLLPSNASQSPTIISSPKPQALRFPSATNTSPFFFSSSSPCPPPRPPLL